jgi:hypothetical protein
MQRAALLAQHRRIVADRRYQINGATDGFADDQHGAQNAPVPVLALLQLTQEVLLGPVEIRLFVHFGTALARRHGQRADMDAISLGALQKRDMPKLRRHRFERRHQIAQHQIVGADLVLIAPAVDEVGGFVKRRINQMGRALHFGGGALALRGVGQVDGDMAGAIKRARLAPCKSYNFASTGCAEVTQGRMSDQPRRACDDHFLVCHSLLQQRLVIFLADGGGPRQLAS